MAVAVFFVPSWGACGVALVASIAAGILFAGMGTAMGSAFTTPCLTLPFCIIVSTDLAYNTLIRDLLRLKKYLIHRTII